MNTKGIKFLAVLAVLAMAFAAFAVVLDDDAGSDAAYTATVTDHSNNDITFNFGVETIEDITTANVQNLTAELNEAAGVITLKGDLHYIADDSATADIIKGWYGGEMPSNFGVIFTIGSLEAGTSKVKLNAGETTVAATEESMYQPLGNERTSTSATSFKVIVKYDGTVAKEYAVDFSQLIKAQTNSKSYFEVDYAIKQATTGSTVTILNDTASDIEIAKAVTLIGSGKEKITGKVFVQFEYDNIMAELGYHGFKDGKIEFRNLNFEVSTQALVNTGNEIYNSLTTVAGSAIVFDGCTIETTAEGLAGVCLWHAPMTLTINNCNFVATAATPGYAITFFSWQDKAGTMIVTGTTFDGDYNRIAGTDDVNDVTFTGNTVKNLAAGKKIVQIAGGQGLAAVADIKANIINNTLPAGVKALCLHDTLNEATIDSINVEGLIYCESVKITVPNNKTMTAGDLTVPAGATLITTATNGTLTVTGTSTIDGTVTNNGKVIVSSAVEATKYTGNIEVSGAEVSGDVNTNPEQIATGGAISAATLESLDGEVIVTDAPITTAEVPAGKALVITEPATVTAVTVKAEKSEVSIVGAAAISFTVDVGGSKKVELTGFSGTATFTKGSIVINGEDFDATDIALHNGDVVKLSGVVGDVTFTYGDTTGTATIYVEEGAEKALTLDGTLTINDAKISLEIDGIVNGAGHAITSKGAVDINDGAIVVNTDFSASTGAVTVYSGSDINAATNTFDWTKTVGSDGALGTWTYNATTDALTISGYNGTYNFGSFAAEIVKIYVNGESSVSYAFAEGFEDTAVTFFGTVTNITSENTGSLAINIDISAIAGAELFQANRLTVVNAGVLDINGVDLAITVSGTNGTWTEDQTKAILATGITATTITTYDAEIAVDVLSAYTSGNAANVLGIATTGEDAEGKISIDKADVLTVKSAGTAVKATNDVTISNSGEATIDGKKAGLTATGKTLKVQTTTGTVSIKGGAAFANLTAMKTTVQIAGTATVTGAVTMSNTSTVKFTGTATIGGEISIGQESVLDLKNANLGGLVTNGGTVNVTGNVAVLPDAIITNNAIITNSGLIGVYGDFNNNGLLTNTGTFEVYKYKYRNVADDFSIAADAATNASNVKLKSIDITDIKLNADGTASVKATVEFYKAVDSFSYGAENFTGTLKAGVDTSYELTLANKLNTATITVKFDASKTGDAAGQYFGKSYSLSVTGTVINAETTYYLESNAADKAITDNIKYPTPGTELNLICSSLATFVNDDEAVITNTGTFVISSGDGAIGGSFVGDLVTNVAETTINGGIIGNITANLGTFVIAGTADNDATVAGNITAKGAVTINQYAALAGDITTDAGVTADGEIIGNITAKAAVTVTDILGNITINANGPINVTIKGDAEGELTYVSKYLRVSTDEEKTTYSAKMSYSGEATGDGFVIILAAGSDATASAAVVPGFFKIGAMADLAAGKTVDLTLTQGKILIDSAVVMKSRYSLTVEAETTIEVNKSAANLDVRNAALKVSKDATANFETGTATPVNYGKVTYIMSFVIQNGAYTIYSNVAYALSNCDEGAELTVGDNAAIDQSVAVPNGVNIIVNNVTLTFDGFDVVMGDGAQITLQGTGKLVFAASGDNTADPELEAGDLFDYYSVSGTVIFGDNQVDLLGVRFTAESTIVGVAATESAPAKISTTLLYNEGTATIAAGTGTGSITLANNTYLTIKGDAESDVLVSATFAVAEGAVFDAVAIADAFGQVMYEEDDDEFVIDEYVAYPTYVSIDGTMNLSANTTINGIWAGTGKVTLPENRTFTLTGGEVPDDDVAKRIASSASFTLVDTTEDENGYIMALVSPEDVQTIVFKAEKVKLGDETVYAMTVNGDYGLGIMEATTFAVLSILTIEEDAALTADVTYLLKDKNSKAEGYLMTKVIFMKVEGVTAFGELDFQVTFEEGDYTVYTYFASVDFEEISDITIVGDQDLHTIAQLGANDKLDLSGNDVNITVAEGSVLTVDRVLIIGTPIVTLGDYGSSIVGTIAIADGIYMVAYSDVDLSEAEILQSNEEDDAVYTMLTIEDVLYATLFANEDAGADEGVRFNDSVNKIKPVIVGYNFTKWYPLNEAANPWIGETDAYAGAKATLVSVTVKYAEGVSYYLDGVEFAIYDTPTKVEYNSVFTAKISNTAKYQGTPLINGKNSFQVTEDSVLVASGVTPIPEPTPEPTAGGMSLTDILLIVLVILIAVMVIIMVLRLNRS